MTDVPPAMERFDARWFASALDAMQDLVLIKGAGSELLWANRAMRDHYGLDNRRLAEEAAARTLLDTDFSNPSDTVQYVRDDLQVFTTGEPLSITEPVTGTDGAVGYYRTRKSAMRLGDDIVGTVGVSTRLEEGQERAAREREQRHEELAGLQRLVDHLPMAVAMVDARGRLISSSRLWAQTFEASHARGARLEVPVEMGLGPLLERALRTGEPGRLQDRASGPQGLRMDLHVHPFLLPDGRLGGAVVVAVDVTEQRRTERSLRTLHQELAQLTYRASHDLLAPLRTSLGWIQLVREDVEAGDQEGVLEGLRRVESSIERLSERVRELSDLALSDATDEPPEWVALHEVVQSVMASFEDPAVDLENAVPLERRLFVPQTRLRAVVQRLIDNGIRYANPEEERSWVRVAVDGEARCVRVQDNGVGMPDPSVDVFGLFVRGTSKRGRHGLGLHIARKHMREMGGELSVDQDQRPTTLVMRWPKEVWE